MDRLTPTLTDLSAPRGHGGDDNGMLAALVDWVQRDRRAIPTLLALMAAAILAASLIADHAIPALVAFQLGGAS
ncbi:hypothetical protein QKW60_05705 [Defluviimonas aestuarii]|uniref:hypothetical protein n=1 Tax=Albidovulum aestuarii TaxID=1130726 RepID=UPI00249C4C4D|nr:hypothetical protein [Defluviimonas aestuarii]MDI3335892.1 hypothetical protein [Defluviimonas aestuarii]